MHKIIIIALIVIFTIYLVYNILIIPCTYKIYYDSFSPYIPDNNDDELYLDTHTNFPFWNSQLGTKRNMSYDLRGDAPIPYFMNLPFNMPESIPIQNRPLSDIS